MKLKCVFLYYFPCIRPTILVNMLSQESINQENSSKEKDIKNTCLQYLILLLLYCILLRFYLIALRCGKPNYKKYKF